MKKALLVLVVLAVVYVGSALALAINASGKNAEFVARLDRLGQLGDTAATSLAAEPELSLAEACKALPEVPPAQIAAYFAKSSLDLTGLSLFPNHALQSFGETAAWPWPRRDTERFMYDLMSDFPPYWPMYLEYWDDPFNHDLADAKYLVVHLLTNLSRPRILDEHTYEAGALTFHSAVIDAQAGKVLCIGSTEVTAKGEVKVYGSGKTDDDAKADAHRRREDELLGKLAWEGRGFGLGELCWLGGKQLCSDTFRSSSERPQ